MSKVVKAIVGAILVVVGLVVPGAQFLIKIGAGLILGALTGPKQPARQASEMTIQLGEQPRSALLGECFTAGSLVDGFDYDGKYGTDWEVLVIRLADHKCHSLTGFYVNDTYVAYTGNGAYAQFNNQLQVHFRADASSAAQTALLTGHWPGWAAGDVGRSGCDVTVFYKADKPNAKNPVWPGGRPRFGWVVKGKLCYDPRLDTSEGGAGAQRWDDPATWQWSENAAVCRYNWVRGIYADDLVDDHTQLLIGRGLSASEAPPANIFSAANLCDEVVDGAPRWRVAGPVYANQSFLEVEEMFTAATAGILVTREGSVELEPGAAKSVVAFFTDDDLVVGSKVGWNQAIPSDADPEWINTVIVNYVEPAQQWNKHDAPVVRSNADVIADGGSREASPGLRLVRWAGQALRAAEIARRLGRLWGRGQVTLGPRFCEIEEGDWVQWQSARRFGGATRNFRVEAYEINEKWHNTLNLREIAASAYGDGAVFDPDYSVATPTAPPPAIGAPGAAQWALAAVTVTSAGVVVPALRLTGSASDDASTEVILAEYWKSDGVINPLSTPDLPPWSLAGSYPPETTRIEITGIEGGATYYAAVTYVVSGVRGERRVLGPVIAANVDVSGAVNPLIAAAVTGLSWKAAVRARTTAALPANAYANGTLGVGATLTGTANGALAAQDGVALVVNERLLVANEAAAARNGIYKLTQLGSGAQPYVLTRASDADEAGELVNATVFVSEGTLHADSQWTCTANAAIVVGTTSLPFAPSFAPAYASIAETSAGTEAAKAVTPDGLAGSIFGKAVVTLQVSDPNGSAITTGDGKAYYRVPAALNGMNLVGVAAHVTTVSSSGLPTVQIANVTDAVDMLSTKLSIDASEKDSLTAATLAVINTAVDDVATGDELRIDIDVAGTGAKGLMVEMEFQLP